MTAWLRPRPDLIQVTYQIRTPTMIDPEKKAKGIALGQTTDTWTPNERSGLKKLEAHRGEVLGIDERTPRDAGALRYEYLITVGYPVANTERDLPSLLTMIFGKISMDGAIRLQDLQLPEAFLKHKGPRHGIAGIRSRVGEPSKPLQMAIFKPCVGLAPSELAHMFFELAMGGMHLVKDDEILPDLAICPAEKRLELCLNAAEKVKAATGRRVLYAVNVTGKTSEIVAKARRLAAAGAECFLFNALSYGYGLLEELREVGIPIMAHPALSGALSASPETGMAYRIVLGTLMRVGGADIVLFPSSYGTVALPHPETMAIKEALTMPLGAAPSRRSPSSASPPRPSAIKPSFPVPSAGIHPGLVPKILKDYGQDVIVNAGGGVNGHPGGARAGAKAFKQAIAWCLGRKNFSGLAQGLYPELDAALAVWGRS